MSKSNLPHLYWRAAVKSYDKTKKLSKQQLLLLTDSARLTPTAYGLQPIKLYVVSDEKIKKQLRAAGYDQPQFEDASHVIVFAARTTINEDDVNSYIKRVSDQRSMPVEELEGFKMMLLGSSMNKSAKELHNWAARQAYIALGISLDVAAQNKIDTTPMEGFLPDKFDEIIGAKEDGYKSVVAITAGFRGSDDKYSKLPKVRKTTGEFVAVVG